MKDDIYELTCPERFHIVLHKILHRTMLCYVHANRINVNTCTSIVSSKGVYTFWNKRNAKTGCTPSTLLKEVVSNINMVSKNKM